MYGDLIRKKEKMSEVCLKETKYKITNHDYCTGCAACVTVCPAACITMKPDKEGFYYPDIDVKSCISCNMCKRICNTKSENEKPVLFHQKEDGDKECSRNVRAYACYNKESAARLRASSGGIFELLAKEILKKNGIVFGVKMDGLKAVHSYVERKEDLKDLLGSKYMQSEVGDAYKKAKDFLNQGRYVLFSGTPCQIDALNKVLHKNYENLLTVDFICHGISSPGVFQRYVGEYIGDNKIIKNISFRDKTEGWKCFSMSIESENRDFYRKNMYEDTYLRSFLKNMNLRTSCFSCKYRKVDRASDLTLGDFWGSNEVFKDWKEDIGYSVVLIQSRKGKQLFQKIEDSIVFREVGIEKIIEHNPSVIASPWDEFSRDLFFKYLKKDTLGNSVRKVEQDGIRKKILRKWWKICKKRKRK